MSMKNTGPDRWRDVGWTQPFKSCDLPRICRGCGNLAGFEGVEVHEALNARGGSYALCRVCSEAVEVVDLLERT